MGKHLERVEDLAGLDDTEMIAYEVTETVTRTATITMSVGHARSLIKHDAARDRDRLVDVNEIRGELEAAIAVTDSDELDVNDNEFSFGDIEVV